MSHPSHFEPLAASISLIPRDCIFAGLGTRRSVHAESSGIKVAARFMIFALLCLLTAGAAAQNPPMTGDPYRPRGNPKSPDGEHEWAVRTTDPVHYELVHVPDGEVMLTVASYYPQANSSNIRYAKAYGVFWNKDGSVVALDELNRRRAGRLYFIILSGGTVRKIRSESILPLPSYADEGRVVVDPGWVSETKIRVRQALETKSGEFVSKFFTIDFAIPDDLKVQPAG
ncbi:MAG: hypothetical protein JO279_16165 [Verrucomicrobia bacterium]|nr:hypothetical protein [Verrucomicrobiota bacterium]